jgi:N-acetylmuramoyl-L-alanine amidase
MTNARQPRSPRRLATVAACLLVCLSASPAPAAATRPSALALSDKALYEDAQAARKRLGASRALLSDRGAWESVIQKYHLVVARYPRSGYCDNALLAVGDLYRQMATRFKRPAYADEATRAYRMLVAEYPSSSLGEAALYAAFQIAAGSGSARQTAEAGRQYLEAYPDSRRAGEVKTAVVKRAPRPEPSMPAPQRPGLAQVYNLRFWSGQDSTRVVIDLERPVALKYDRLSNPDRLWIDLIGTRLHPNLDQRAFPVGDGLLEKIRLGPNRESVIRVVLDFKDVDEHSVFFLKDPVRLVIDVRGGAPQPAGETATRVASATPAPAATPAAAPSQPPSQVPASPSSSPSPAVLASPALPDTARSPDPTPSAGPTAAPTARPPEPATVTPERRAGDPVPSSPAPAPTPTPSVADLPAPEPPQANRTGSYSLARQLGLHARRIVIDAGHGGHDPGTIGRGGLQEKELVLDVALRLARMVKEELGAEVLLTRSSDVFIPLEERTAIANTKRADLFLSIHANASRNRKARGIETYFLSFAKNAHAEEVAARENAISGATLKDLNNLVKAIALPTKIEESRDFASAVQESLVGELKPHYPAVVDRGVHTAPFYVLIGANMPAVLAEIAFVSHPQEEKLLKTRAYRDHIARSLLEGVRRYLDALNRTQTRQLTAGNGQPRVSRGSGGR